MWHSVFTSAPRCQTEPNFIFLENRVCCSVCWTFQHVTFNQFYVQMGYSPMKIFRKRGNCFKRSIKYYYIESHSVENLPNQPLQSCRGIRNQRMCVVGRIHLYQLQVPRGLTTTIHLPSSKTMLALWRDLGVTFKGSLGPRPLRYLISPSNKAPGCTCIPQD